jgi:hypothetical protein
MRDMKASGSDKSAAAASAAAAVVVATDTASAGLVTVEAGCWASLERQSGARGAAVGVVQQLLNAAYVA